MKEPKKGLPQFCFFNHINLAQFIHIPSNDSVTGVVLAVVLLLLWRCQQNAGGSGSSMAETSHNKE